VAALIEKATAADVELIEGNRGEFTVWVGPKQVAAKTPSGFPSDEDCVAAVRDAPAEKET
jgi:hypothetical protein